LYAISCHSLAGFDLSKHLRDQEEQAGGIGEKRPAGLLVDEVARQDLGTAGVGDLAGADALRSSAIKRMEGVSRAG
jgi:hypothetical protein